MLIGVASGKVGREPNNDGGATVATEVRRVERSSNQGVAVYGDLASLVHHVWVSEARLPGRGGRVRPRPNVTQRPDSFIRNLKT